MCVPVCVCVSMDVCVLVGLFDLAVTGPLHCTHAHSSVLLCWIQYCVVQCMLAYNTYTVHVIIQLLTFPAGFFRELWYLARAIILAFFVAVLISSVFSAQVRGGSE